MQLIGDGGATITLQTYSIEIASATQFSISITNTIDQASFSQQIDSNGLLASDGTVYQLRTLSSWNGLDSAPSTNTIYGSTATLLVSNIPTASINSVLFDYSNNLLTFNGTNLINIAGLSSDISTTLLSITGEGTLTNTPITYALSSYTLRVSDNSSFSISLNNTDTVIVRDLLNKIGFNSNDGITYTLSAKPQFNGIASLLSTSTIRTINIPTTTIDTALYTYDNNNKASTLTVAASNLIRLAGNDINSNAFIITGEGGTLSLRGSYIIEIASVTQFVIALDVTDTLAVNSKLNANGNSSILGTVFNLVANAKYNGVNSITDTIATITVSGVVAPDIASATFNYGLNQLIVYGDNFATGATINLNALSITGEGSTTINASRTLTASSYTISSDQQFIISLTANDTQAIRNLLNRTGTQSNSGVSYTLSATNFWHTNRAPNDSASITVINIPSANVINATYTYSPISATLVVSASNLINLFGPDISTTLIRLTGDGNIAYNLSAYGQQISSATLFVIKLNSTDTIAINELLDSNGQLAGDGTSYTLTASAGYNGLDSGLATSAIVVIGVPSASIATASFDYTKGVLTVSGTNLITLNATNDINTTKLNIFGEGSTSYTLSAYPVTVTNNSFVISLDNKDIEAIRDLLNAEGLSSNNSTTYTLTADNGFNGITSQLSTASILVINIPTPSILYATYTRALNTSPTLVVSATNLLRLAGSDISPTLLSITGENNASYTLSGNYGNIEINATRTAFVITINNNDATQINKLLNKNGNSSILAISYNLQANPNFNGSRSTVTSDVSITVAGIITPDIISTTFDYTTAQFVVTATNLFINAGISTTLITITGEGTDTSSGSSTYRLTSLSTATITNSSEFVISLAGDDITQVRNLLNRVGLNSNNNIAYNIAFANFYNSNASPQDSSKVTTTNIPTATINSATYDANSNLLTVTASNLIKLFNNDINTSKLQLIGDGGATITLQTYSIEIASATQFSISITNTIDQASFSQQIDSNGLLASDGTVYQLITLAGWNGIRLCSHQLNTIYGSTS